MRKIIRNQAGDTIIEVMIAVIVVGLAIGLAYGTASRSLRGIRQSQERAEALKKVEGQIERLKALAHTNNQLIFGNNQVYCIVDIPATEDSPAQKNKKIQHSGKISLPTLSGDPLGDSYPSQCIEGLYHIAIATKANNQFTVTARWFGIGENEKEEVKINYRIHPS